MKVLLSIVLQMGEIKLKYKKFKKFCKRNIGLVIVNASWQVTTHLVIAGLPDGRQVGARHNVVLRQSNKIFLQNSFLIEQIDFVRIFRGKFRSFFFRNLFFFGKAHNAFYFFSRKFTAARSVCLHIGNFR